MDSCIKKGKYKAVFSDIDGTLLNTSHKIPGKKPEKKIRKMNKKRISICIGISQNAKRNDSDP